MFVLLANWILSAVALYLVSKLTIGIQVTGFSSAMAAIIIISLVNLLIKPLFVILTFPVTIITLGLFSIIINACMFLLASKLSPGFTVDSFGSAILGSILYSVINYILRWLIK